MAVFAVGGVGSCASDVFASRENSGSGAGDGRVVTFISSYKPDAPLPKRGSRWVWEIDKPHARQLIEILDVSWNGEGWWVRTKALIGSLAFLPVGLGGEGAEGTLNDLSRFWEACTPVGHSRGKLTEHRPRDAVADMKDRS